MSATQTLPVLQRIDSTEFSVQDEKFAAEVNTELGYKALLNQTLPGTVVQCLQRIGLRPFDERIVNSYKEFKENKTNNKIVWTALGIMVFVVLAPIIVAIITSDLGGLLLWFPSLFGGAIVLVNLTIYSWEFVALCDYNSPVPKYVLETAVCLDKELKKSGFKPNEDYYFVVDHLEKTYDPFLVLCVGSKKLWLEVWDEPDFGAKRTV